MRTVLLIRHGVVSEEAEERFLGAADAPMGAAGEAQISELAARLRARVTPDTIYCSDLSRSLRTAELLAGGSGVPVRVRPALREIDMGDWQGLSRREVAERRPADYLARGRDIANFRPPGGESFADVASRALPCWRDIVEDGEAQVVAIASHAGVNRVLLCHLLGAPLANLFRIAQRPACLNVVEWRKDGNRCSAPTFSSSGVAEIFGAFGGSDTCRSQSIMTCRRARLRREGWRSSQAPGDGALGGQRRRRRSSRRPMRTACERAMSRVATA